MVFCGKPSKGCGTCRARKIKCDQSEPSCRRCSTTGRACPGYRDQQDLVFRDENNRTINRALKARARSDLAADKRSEGILNELTEKAVVSQSPRSQDTNFCVPGSLLPPIKDQANWFFFNNYHVEESGFYKGHFTDLPSIISQVGEGEALSKAISSIGLASLSNIRNDPHAHESSRREYMSALRLINTALRDPVEVKKNHTILAVMLLGLYEIITCDTPRSMTTWIKHIDGAVAILKSHDDQLFRSKTWTRIFLQLRPQAITSSLQMGVAVHPTVVEWSEQIRTFETADEAPINQVNEILIRLCSLRASMKDGASSNHAAFFTSLLSVDAELASCFKTCPSNLTYTTVNAKSSSSNNAYADHYHIYPNHAAATILNNYRCTRVIIHDKVLKYLSDIPTPPSPDLARLHNIQRETSKTIILKITNQICASVPYYFGAHIQHQTPTYTPKAICGYFLRWPLFVVAGTDNVPDSMREWAIAQLQRIGCTMGIQQTMAMADELKSELKS